jgi:hypothetical protein
MNIANLRKEHEKSLASIKKQHDASTKKIREDKKGGKMGVIEKHVLLTSLKENILDVTFKKMDGSVRVMKCTLRPDYLPGPPEEETVIGKDYTQMDIDSMYQFCGDNPDRWASAMSANSPDFQKISMYVWLTQWLPHVIESSVAARRSFDRNQIIKVWELNRGWRSFYLDRVTGVQLANP